MTKVQVPVAYVQRFAQITFRGAISTVHLHVIMDMCSI